MSDQAVQSKRQRELLGEKTNSRLEGVDIRFDQEDFNKPYKKRQVGVTQSNNDGFDNSEAYCRETGRSSSHQDVPERKDDLPSMLDVIAMREGLESEKDIPYLYKCPVEGCSHAFCFSRDLDPPLNQNRMVSDAEPWSGSLISAKLNALLLHFSKHHPYLTRDDWPPAYKWYEKDCNEYPCSVKGCPHIFFFNKAFNLPLRSDGTVDDSVQWNPFFTENKIICIRGHLRRAHPQLKTLPLAIAPRRKGVQRAKVVSLPTASAKPDNLPETLKPVGLPKKVRPDDALYICPIKCCEYVIPFDRKLNPPLDSNGLVDDSVTWSNGKFLTRIKCARNHFRHHHPEVAKMDWPVAFTARPKETRPVGEKCEYICSVEGCGRSTQIPVELDPPLDENGEISDCVRWPSSLYNFVGAEVNHLRKCHPQVPEEKWPLAFRVTAKTYECPVEDCGHVFTFPMEANIPTDSNGNIIDTKRWGSGKNLKKEGLSTKIYSVRRHMREKHPSVPPTAWPAGFAPRGYEKDEPRPNAISSSVRMVKDDDTRDPVVEDMREVQVKVISSSVGLVYRMKANVSSMKELANKAPVPVKHPLADSQMQPEDDSAVVDEDVEEESLDDDDDAGDDDSTAYSESDILVI